jgi:hypothetical protein
VSALAVALLSTARLLLAALYLAGCTEHIMWAGGNPAAFAEDEYACQYEAETLRGPASAAVPPRPPVPNVWGRASAGFADMAASAADDARARGMYIKCMEARGWRRQ